MVVLGPPAAAVADGLGAPVVAGAAPVVAGAAPVVAAAAVVVGAAAEAAGAPPLVVVVAGVAVDFELDPHAVASRVVAASALANTRRLDTALSMDPPVALPWGRVGDVRRFRRARSQ